MKTIFYMIEDSDLAKIKALATRLHSETRMVGDEMRDAGHTLDAVARGAIECPAPPPPVTGDADAFIDLDALRKAVETLRTQALFECDALTDRMDVAPFAEQHFLLALGALETAARNLALASLHDAATRSPR